MRYILFALLFLISLPATAQQLVISGHISDIYNHIPDKAEVYLSAPAGEVKGTTDPSGFFRIRVASGGRYTLHIIADGYEGHTDTLVVKDTITDAGIIMLHPLTHMLNEVIVAQKVLSMVQKDDTLEYNPAAFKVNPDADAADLLKKMPAINISGKNITAQGEAVVRILVDGKPFFNEDPYATLKVLPADVIARVQVYNEKSEQEQFTGFNEGSTSKTVNIVTRKDKRRGIFGKVYGGGGGNSSNDAPRYGTGGSLNNFAGDRRLTLTAQSNNINEQNFSDQNVAAQGETGLTRTNATGLNYSDKLGKKVDMSAGYFLTNTDNTSETQLSKQFFRAADSGLVYTGNSKSIQHGLAHSVNLNLTYKIDSVNSVTIHPRLSASRSGSAAYTDGYTAQTNTPVNRTDRSGISDNTSYNCSGYALFRHRFHKKGKTLSASGNITRSNTGTDIQNLANNIYYSSVSPGDTIDQQGRQSQQTLNQAYNATYTAPSGKNGLLKASYDFLQNTAISEKRTADYVPAEHAYTTTDTVLSSSYKAHNFVNKPGISYQYAARKWDMSAGMNAQYTSMAYERSFPSVLIITHTYKNLLPVITLRCKFSKTSNLQANYTTSAQLPQATQLTNTINNTDPLHLYAGNPQLRQAYINNITLRFGKSSADAKRMLSVSSNAQYTNNVIVSSSIIASKDSLLQTIPVLLHRGSMLTIPVNMNGSAALGNNINYGMPLDFLKCRLNIAAAMNLSRTPLILNGTKGYLYSSNSSGSLTVTSAINEHIDFIISAKSALVKTHSTLEPQKIISYINSGINSSLNLMLWHGLVLNTLISYSLNSGLSSGFNNNYVLWNIGLGKKLFRKQQAEIKLSAFDILNQNNNIQHTVAETYIQDSRTNMIQRYYLLTFTYKFSEFRK